MYNTITDGATCQHRFCGSDYSPRPFIAEFVIRHSGYTIPLCNVHYHQMREDLIRASIAFTGSLIRTLQTTA